MKSSQLKKEEKVMVHIQLKFFDKEKNPIFVVEIAIKKVVWLFVCDLLRGLLFAFKNHQQRQTYKHQTCIN